MQNTLDLSSLTTETLETIVAYPMIVARRLETADGFVLPSGRAFVAAGSWFDRESATGEKLSCFVMDAKDAKSWSDLGAIVTAVPDRPGLYDVVRIKGQPLKACDVKALTKGRHAAEAIKRAVDYTGATPYRLQDAAERELNRRSRAAA